jgi:hypothetical protein
VKRSPQCWVVDPTASQYETVRVAREPSSSGLPGGWAIIPFGDNGSFFVQEKQAMIPPFCYYKENTESATATATATATASITDISTGLCLLHPL